MDQVDDFVVLAKKSTKKVNQSKGTNYYGIAALSAGAIATVAFMYRKRQEKMSSIDGAAFIDEDEEFVLV